MKDFVREMCIRQGYVPKGCTLNGHLVWGLINRSEDPCDGCNEDRSLCGGRRADPDYMAKRMAEKQEV